MEGDQRGLEGQPGEHQGRGGDDRELGRVWEGPADGGLRSGSIRAADGERIALAVAEANGCGYCLSAHSYLATNVARLDASEIELARRFDSSAPKSAAILHFADAVLRNQGRVGQDVIDEARAAGLHDAQLGDIVGHVAVNVLTNYFNNTFDVDIDFPVVTPGSAAGVR